MEVHHHAHTARRKWAHYFWEFLMLFLAVFCGFLAEYQLEHLIEKDREKQYMKSIVEDLQNDTTAISNIFNLGASQLRITDSLVDLLNNEVIVSDNINRLYLLVGNSTRVVHMEFETRTSSQLKNAGGMRLIRKKTVADSILNYWTIISVCDNISERLERIGIEKNDISIRLFHNKYYIRDSVPMFPVIGIREGAKLIQNDQVLIAQYSNLTYQRKLVLSNYLRMLASAKQKAAGLIRQIREEYRVK